MVRFNLYIENLTMERISGQIFLHLMFGQKISNSFKKLTGSKFFKIPFPTVNINLTI